jgi:outer membrane protein OmpA-like peptidoglycan-associated protein
MLQPDLVALRLGLGQAPQPVGTQIHVQPHLTVSNPGDASEQEADRIADQVMRMPGPQPKLAGTPELGRMGGAAASSPANGTQEVGRAESGNTVMGASQLAIQNALSSSGQPLDAATRSFFEPRFGSDLSQVRIHTGEEAAESARAIDALAYTSGSEIVFGAGQYAPQTQGGQRLLAHELAHVHQQVGATLSRAPATVQRQPASSTLQSDPDATAVDPGYEESAQAPSYRVRIVAHASPRWRGAPNAAEADRLNQELSQRRADEVRDTVERLLAKHGMGSASVTYDTSVEPSDDTVELQSEARGSRETLAEAKGDRSSNAMKYRRVDVIIESNQRVSGTAGASRPLLTRSTASRFWHVSVDMSAGGSLGAAGSLLSLTLFNDMSDQSMTGKVFAGGGGPKASLGASVSIWSDPTGFSTDEPVNFQDFDGMWIRYTTAGVNFFIGYEKSYIDFFGMGSDAQNIDVGGWNTGTVGIGGSVVTGPLSLDGSYPPTQLPIKDTDTTFVPYERNEGGKDVHQVLFPTGEHELPEVESNILESYLMSVAASKR